MKTEYLSQNILNILPQRDVLAMLCGLLAVSNIVLASSLLFSNEKIIIIPPETRQSFWVKGSTVSKEYLEDMGWGLSKLLLDLTPSSYPYNHEKLLTFSTPEAHGILKRQLTKEGENYKSLKLSTHFFPSEITVDPKTLLVEVKGTLQSYVAGKLVKTTDEKVSLKFTQRGGGLLLESISGTKKEEELYDL